MTNVYPLIITMVMAVTTLSAATAEAVAPESMSLLARQNWAVMMIERLDEANRVILDPEYVARQRERFEEMATPFVIGTSKEKARQTVQALRDEVEKSERIAVEHLDRQFRQTLTRQLKRKSEQRLRRLWFQGWQKTVQAWQKSDDQKDRFYQVLNWLQESCDTLEAKSYARVTPVPSFKEVVVKEVTPPKQVAEKPKAPKPEVLKPKKTEPLKTEPLKTEPLKTEPRKTATSVVPPSQRMTPPEIPPGLSMDRTADRSLPPRRVVRKPVTPPLNINLPELAAQVSGTNLALRRLEAKLVASGRWDAKRIDPFVVQLKKIAMRLEDARLFYRLLAPSQQSQIDKIVDPTAAIKILRSKIRTARVATLEKRGPSASLTKEQRTELKHLDRLTDEVSLIDRSQAVN